MMVKLPDNGRMLRNGDPLLDAIKAKQAECRAAGVPYPKLPVEDYYSLPYVWSGKVPYHAETLEILLVPNRIAGRPVPLPDDFVITGEERMPGETSPQYARYLAYRDLGPERSLNKAAKLMGKPTFMTAHRNKVAVSGPLSAMASRWRWVERAGAYDSRMAVAARKAMEQINQELQIENATRKQTYLDNEFAIVQRGVERIKEMLDFPLTTTRTQESEVEGEDGEITVVKTTIIEPKGWTYASLSQFMGEIAKIARLNLGLATSNSAQRIESNVADAKGRQSIPLAEQAAHDYAAAKAEEAYFAALEEYQRDHAAPERIPAHVVVAAD